MTRATPRQHDRPQHDRSGQHPFWDGWFHASPYVACAAIMAGLALAAVM